MTVRVITDKKLWDKFIDDSPYGLLFHKWDFLKTIEKHTGYKLMTYGVYKGTELICVFPLFMRKYMGMKMVFSPPPRTGVPNLGFVMNNMYDSVRQSRKESYLDTVVDEINGEINKFSPNYVSIVMTPKFNDIRPFKWSRYHVNVLYSYIIDLTCPAEAIWEGFDNNCKKNLRSCKKYGLELKETKDVNLFHNLMMSRYNEQGLNYPIISPDYLKDLLDIYPDNLTMYFLYHEGRVIGLELVLRYKDRLMLWMGESIIQKEIPANYYMRWELIKRAKAEGFKILEIEGANTRHLCTNKARFNPGLDRCYNILRKDALGQLAEWTYHIAVKRKISV